MPKSYLCLPLLLPLSFEVLSKVLLWQNMASCGLKHAQVVNQLC